ncbi:MAG TPA: helix-turn-helix domain-containing protein [Bacteroidota bacterium]|nr:helix-turn-helix domain-containing protein [Bacteroidota bacterium]
MNTEQYVIGESEFVRTINKEIPKLARHKRNIVIIGAPGTGRGFLAQAIHRSSGFTSSMMSLNPISSTDADLAGLASMRPAENSRILFHDLEEFSLLHQTRIARIIAPLSAQHAPQIIVTLNGGVQDLVHADRLVPDLADILKGFTAIAVPSLHERPEDIPLLTEHFIRNACEAIGAKPKVIDVNELDFLIRREYQGNVRELKSIIESAVINSPDNIVRLPDRVRDEMTQLQGILQNISQKKSFSFDSLLANLEKSLIERALLVAGNSQTRAAEILQIGEPNLRYRLKKYRIPSVRSTPKPRG